MRIASSSSTDTLSVLHTREGVFLFALAGGIRL
jgi:hypothetical protein